MRRAFFVALIALVVSAGVLPATAAAAGDTPRVRYYAGPTSDGGRLRIRVVVSNGVPYLSELSIKGPYTCEDGTEGEVETGVGWFPKGPAIADQHLELSENWHAIAFAVAGRLGSQRGSGTLTFLLPWFTADQQAAQVCTMGELTWSVERTSGGAFSFRPAVTLVGAGGRTLKMSLETKGFEETTLPARAEAGPIRHYRGHTSQDRYMSAMTQRTDEGIALLRVALGISLRCEDGTDVEGGIRRPLFDAPLLLPGRLDLDEEPFLSLADVTRIHGELDAHSGSGTWSVTWAMLTDDLQGQLCKSGDQTWRLWRTDAGY